MLCEVLRELGQIRTDGAFTFSVVVVDNDLLKSAEAVARGASAAGLIRVDYVVEPRKGFPFARNCALDHASGDFIAFIDDDEIPSKDWLRDLHAALTRSNASGVLGPVLPRYVRQPPRWLEKSGLCVRPEHKSGEVMNWHQTRTGNVLFRRHIVDQGIRFKEDFVLGGEDVDFFRRAIQAGHIFVWCAEAPVFEHVGEERLTRSYYLWRALTQGSISAGYSRGEGVLRRTKVAAKAIAGVISYSCLVPLTFLVRPSLGMKCLIKNCHHLGRLLTICGVKPVSTRP
jgi:succinoglycan biosynthesis protein ExoM